MSNKGLPTSCSEDEPERRTGSEIGLPDQPNAPNDVSADHPEPLSKTWADMTPEEREARIRRRKERWGTPEERDAAHERARRFRDRRKDLGLSESLVCEILGLSPVHLGWLESGWVLEQRLFDERYAETDVEERLDDLLRGDKDALWRLWQEMLERNRRKET